MVSSASLSLPSSVHVVEVHGSLKTVASRAFAPGEFILRAEGVVRAQPDRGSLQIGEHEHLVVPPGLTLAEQRERFPFRFLDHSCDPNACFRGRDLVATRSIAAGEPVTFDYDTTEFDMASPFLCTCGAACCIGEVRGYRHLDAARRQRIRGDTAPWVAALAQRSGLTG